MSQTQVQTQPDSLFASYRPLSGVFDEAFSDGGDARPVFRSLLDGINRLGSEEVRSRWARAQEQIQRNGITYNPYDDDGLVSRPWTLDAIPMVLADAEWSGLADKLSQRARVLEALLADLFGEQRVIRDRIIPPDLLFGHPAWYPSYQGLYAPGHSFLAATATDLARAPDGKWWATGDRSRSPFGLGYVLENRIVASRLLSEPFRAVPVRRLAGFYSSLKDELRRLAEGAGDNPRIVVWTKGPQSRGYFEDSYLARYLGYTLAEGDDLAVRGNSVKLLTLGGLVPVDVLFRRIDDDDCDSVELNPSSQFGISSLLDVMRDQRVAVANAVGSRIVESPAFLPFLRAVSKYLLGEELQLSSVATWWCGDPKACENVISRLDQLLIRPAFRMNDVRPVVGQSLSREARAALIERIRASPHQYVGQEIVKRSTTPVLTDAGAVPWYMSLRAYLVRKADGFQVLPGGLARVSPDSDSLNFTMTAGERSQDVWVVADEDVDQETLLESSGHQLVPRRTGAELPSRVADNLFWLGRYTERSMQAGRLLLTLLTRVDSERTNGPEIHPLLKILANRGQIEADYTVPEPGQDLSPIVESVFPALFDPERPYSVRASVMDMTRTAMRVRDRISSEMWLATDRLDSLMRATPSPGAVQAMDLIEVLETAIGHLSALTGMVAEGMTRTLGWRFYDLGLRIERSSQLAVLLKSFFVSCRSEDTNSLETVLTLTNSLMTYRNRYLSTFQVPVTLDLLMTDTTNPRSLIYQLSRICQHLDAMPECQNQALLHAEQKVAMSIAHSVRLCDVYEMSHVNDAGHRPQLEKLLTRIDEQLPKLSDTVTSRYLIHAGLPRHFGASSVPGGTYGASLSLKAN